MTKRQLHCGPELQRMASPPKDPNPSPTLPPVPADLPSPDTPTGIPQPGPDSIPTPDEPLQIPPGTPPEMPPSAP
jgi:hypothetical protein